MKKRHIEREKLRRGIYVLPNLFTTLNLFCGFLSVLAAIEGHFEKSAFLIIGGAVFDILDGKTARLTKTTSRFGVEYDSLADLITFGLAPGILAYLWVLQPFGKLGWLVAMIFLACGALRLARFNTHVDTADSSVFTGLPIPGAAGMTATTVLFTMKVTGGQGPGPYVAALMLAGMFALSFLMVSAVPYTSFKKMPPVLVRAKHFNMLVIAVLLLVFIVQEPVVALFTLGALYVSSGPFRSVRRVLSGAHRHPDEEADELLIEADDELPDETDIEASDEEEHKPYRI
ncbi:MAG: CDP-diacylglycerol--serine O-phosphatidyltransferase [Thermodesulfobacteriota bacterium]